MTAKDKIIRWLNKGSWDVKLAQEAAESVWGTGASIPPRNKRGGADFARFEKKLGEFIAKRARLKATQDVLRALAMSALPDQAAKAAKEIARSLN